MHEDYTEAIREELSGIRIVIDCFHATEAYRDELDSLRKQELARLKKELSTQDYKLLKGSTWALPKETQDLTQKKARPSIYLDLEGFQAFRLFA